MTIVITTVWQFSSSLVVENHYSIVSSQAVKNRSVVSWMAKKKNNFYFLGKFQNLYFLTFIFTRLFFFSVLSVLQGCGGCAFRDARLQTSAGTSGYLSSCCLSMVSNQSDRCDLWPPDIRRGHFPPDNCRWLIGYCLFSGATSVNPRRGCVSVKIPVWQQFAKRSDLQPDWHLQPT